MSNWTTQFKQIYRFKPDYRFKADYRSSRTIVSSQTAAHAVDNWQPQSGTRRMAGFSSHSVGHPTATRPRVLWTLSVYAGRAPTT